MLQACKVLGGMHRSSMLCIASVWHVPECSSHSPVLTAGRMQMQMEPLPAKQPFQRFGSGLPAAKDSNASAPMYATQENYPNVPNVPTHAIHRNESGRYGMPVYH